MALPPIVAATLQSAIIASFSNILAQIISSYRNDTTLVIDWVPIVQFFIFASLNTPPNILWQEFLESTFPASHVAPTKKAVASASASDEKSLDQEAKEGQLMEPKLNVNNTLIKTLLDQTAGAAVNTLLFSLFMNGVKAAMAHQQTYEPPSTGTLQGLGFDNDSLAFLFSGGAVNYAAVEWASVLAKSRAEFWTFMKAGWTFWPFVSLVNFAFIKSVQTRNLVGSLAGVAWGVYVSIMSADR